MIDLMNGNCLKSTNRLKDGYSLDKQWIKGWINTDLGFEKRRLKMLIKFLLERPTKNNIKIY